MAYDYITVEFTNTDVLAHLKDIDLLRRGMEEMEKCATNIGGRIELQNVSSVTFHEGEWSFSLKVRIPEKSLRESFSKQTTEAARNTS
jgi:hypothetical protein